MNIDGKWNRNTASAAFLFFQGLWEGGAQALR